MKLVFEDGELERIREVYDTAGTNIFPRDFLDNEFGITFKVTDPALAERILGGLLWDKLPDLNLGFKVTSIQFKPISDTTLLKDKLKAAIDQVIDNR